ncbi:propane 2-monooxygenase effector subunit MimD [Mycobacterium botniense]|uniref:Monooxygenase n=1 Tax=Mycobacterium botniense TaxID=84962 RepID=A0A7I9XTR5_9MYCO|nr:MmoB/DmpM family protein [Mycobacterium botniense]GFG73325.1 monooxygenase [Mycobacterium botniense]
MTTTAHPENPLKKEVPSPFKADSTPSNECGFTLMNNQVGEIIADVMRRQPNVRVSSPLPSLIRVDGKNRIEVIFAEIDEAAGEEPGWFNQAEFEENMSTHYGRMVFLDDRAMLFANPEDAAEYLGFDLVATE